MSSACVCHTDEFCFYCEVYSPLERKHEMLVGKLEKIKNILSTIEEKRSETNKESIRALDVQNNPNLQSLGTLLRGQYQGMGMVTYKLKEVLARETNNQHRSDGRGTDDATG